MTKSYDKAIALFRDKYVSLTEQGVKISSKDSHWLNLWKVIDKVLKVITFGRMNSFLKEFTTTFGKNIDFPYGWRPYMATERSYVVLCHEEVHVNQYLKLGLGNAKIGMLVMGFLYLFVFLPVVGAWFRYYFEREAYLEGIKAWKRLGYNSVIDNYVDILAGPSYVWAWPFKRSIKKWFEKELRK